MTLPRVGMLATVRNRRGVISAVEPFAASKSSALLHLVTIEFSDSDGDAEETLLWERERHPVVLEPNALPRVDVDATMRMREFLALQRATRWTAITPFLSADSPERRAEQVLTAPVYGAVMSEHLHGNAQTAKKDRQIRDELLSQDYEVVAIQHQEVYDKTVMRTHMRRIAKAVAGRAKAQEVEATDSWFVDSAAVETGINLLSHLQLVGDAVHMAR